MGFVCIKSDKDGDTYIPERQVRYIWFGYCEGRYVTRIIYTDEMGEVARREVDGEPRFIGIVE